MEVKSSMRLDEVVQEVYGDLDMFDAVAEGNPDLLDVVLNVGDVVVLPDLVKQEIEEALW